MPIRIAIKSETGELLHRGGLYSPPTEGLPNDLYPLLSGIDPYGDTVFNRLQWERLRSEAMLRLEATSSEDERTSMAELIDSWARYGRPHSYLWFVGD